MELEITINQATAGIVTLSPVGPINTETSVTLDKEIERVLSKSVKGLVLDMEEVDFITSAGVGIIVKIKISLNRKGCEFAMFNLQPQIKKAFDTIHLTPILDVFTSKKELDEYLLSDFRLQFRQWKSRAGLKTLQDLITRDMSLPKVERKLKLSGWEVDLIVGTMTRLKKQYGDTIGTRQLSHIIRDLAETIDFLRTQDPLCRSQLDRLTDRFFTGKLGHLARLLAYKDDEWNRWRRQAHEVPDLRNADIRRLDLSNYDLCYTLLRGAELSGAILHNADLREADLRNCMLRNTFLSGADLYRAKFVDANLSHTMLTEANLSHADLRRSFLIGTSMNEADFRGADLRGAVAWGISVRDIQCNQETQQKGMLVPRFLKPPEYLNPDTHDEDYRSLQNPEASMRVNYIEVVPFVSLLIDNPKIGHVINAAADKVVLLLGRFRDHEQCVLNAIKEALPSFGYVPVVFDFDEPENRDTIETVAVLAGISNFVIADLSRPRSAALEAHLVIPAIAVPFVPIIHKREQPFSMFTALQRKYPWVLRTVQYRDEKDLMRKLKRRVIQPAELKAATIRRLKHPKKDKD